MSNGFLIVLDGSNGAGKSTVAKAIINFFNEHNLEYTHTREPGGTPIGEKIRDLVLDPENKLMHELTELLLFCASRAQHIQERILPAIRQGKIVLSDRFDSATISFQHYARGLPLEKIQKANNVALNGFKPRMTIILDLDPRIGLARIKKIQRDNADRIEQQDIEALERARQGYLEQALNDPEHFTIVDASQPIERVIHDVLTTIKHLTLTT